MIERLAADLRSVNELYPETHIIEKRRVIQAIQEFGMRSLSHV